MNQDHKIEAEAIVVRIIPNAMSDEYDSGAFVAYDATELKLLSPSSLAGRPLMIYHVARALPQDHPLRRSGVKIRFSIQESHLSSPTLFDGALSNVELLPLT
jgi:hypothetical protein